MGGAKNRELKSGWDRLESDKIGPSRERKNVDFMFSESCKDICKEF